MKHFCPVGNLIYGVPQVCVFGPLNKSLKMQVSLMIPQLGFYTESRKILEDLKLSEDQ